MGQLKIIIIILLSFFCFQSCSTMKDNFFIYDKENEVISFYKKENELLKIVYSEIGYNKLFLKTIDENMLEIEFANKEFFVVEDWSDKHIVIKFFINSDLKNDFVKWINESDNKPIKIGAYSLVYNYQVLEGMANQKATKIDSLYYDDLNFSFKFYYNDKYVEDIRVDKLLFNKNKLVKRVNNNGYFVYTNIELSGDASIDVVINHLRKSWHFHSA